MQTLLKFFWFLIKFSLLLNDITRCVDLFWIVMVKSYHRLSLDVANASDDDGIFGKEEKFKKINLMR